MNKESFEDSRNKKMSDMIFKTKIAIGLLTIILCASAMMSTAFALFNDTTSYSSRLKSATWRVLVESTEMGVVHGDYFCAQAEDDKHAFIINANGTPGASGYCIITITSPDGEVSRYNTDVFDDELYLLIQAQEGCRISFKPHWGDPRNFGNTNFTRGIILHSVTPVEEEEEELLSPEEGEINTDSGDILDQLLGVLGEGNTESSAPSDNAGESTGILDMFVGVFGSSENDATSTPSVDAGGDNSSSTPSVDAGGDNSSSAPSVDAGGDDSSSAPSGDAGGDDSSSAPSEDVSGNDSPSAPSEDVSGNDSPSAPSGDVGGNDSSSAPSGDVGGGVDVAPPPSSSVGDNGTSSSDSSGGDSSPAPSGGSDSSGGGESSSASSGDGE